MYKSSFYTKNIKNNISNEDLGILRKMKQIHIFYISTNTKPTENSNASIYQDKKRSS